MLSTATRAVDLTRQWLCGLSRALTEPRCLDCGAWMRLQHEEPFAERPTVFQLFFVCDSCGGFRTLIRGYELSD